VCWGVLAKVVSVDGMFAEVEMGSTRVRALIATEGVEPGDIVIVHAGAVISRVTREELLDNVAIYLELTKIHYEFNGYPPEEAERMALEDVKKFAEWLGVGMNEVLKALERVRSEGL